MSHVRARHGPARSTMALLAWVACVARLTLWPEPQSTMAGFGAQSLCVICGPRGLGDAILNWALFVPLGALLAIRGAGVRGVALVGLGVSVLIEVTQLTVPGRHVAIGDVIWNSLGASAGLAAEAILNICWFCRAGRIL